METIDAVTALSALAHEGRLTIFRELVQAGPSGLPSGEIGRRMGVPASTMSASLAVLAHAGLVTARREGRSIIYQAAYKRMGALLGFLVRDCCGGRPEVCAPLVAITRETACCV